MKKILIIPFFLCLTYVNAQINLVKNSGIEYVKKNLGTNVNTRNYELLPIISADGKTLYICRDGDTTSYGGEDIYVSKIQKDGTWGKAENVGNVLNNSYNNSLISVLTDNNTVYLSNIYNSNGTMSRGISYSILTNTGWQFPKPLEIKNYYSNSSYGNFNLSSSRNILLMSVKRNDSKGGNDLYVSFFQEDSTYSEPLNMGDSINTSDEECSPFIASDDKTMYFSSNGHPGYGDNDIFVSHRLDDTWTNWSKPENLGNKINTSSFDAFFTVPASGSFAYFCSYENSYGESDIFQIELPKEAKPAVVALVKGKVLNSKTNEPMAVEIIYKNIATQTKIGTANSSSDGTYQIVLNAGVNYSLYAQKDSFNTITETVDLTTISEYKEIDKNLLLTPFDKKITNTFVKNLDLDFKNILFETNSSVLSQEANLELDKLIIYLNSNSKSTLEIYGYTDNVGSDNFNLALSQKRAKSVSDYLINKGIAKSRLTTKALGNSNPVVTNDSDSNKAKNRRVELKIK